MWNHREAISCLQKKGRKNIACGCLVTFWLSIFTISFRATGVLLVLKALKRWTTCCPKGLQVYCFWDSLHIDPTNTRNMQRLPNSNSYVQHPSLLECMQQGVIAVFTSCLMLHTWVSAADKSALTLPGSTADGFHGTFYHGPGNWRALHHHTASLFVNIHITWPFCPPVSLVKNAMESIYTCSSAA